MNTIWRPWIFPEIEFCGSLELGYDVIFKKERKLKKKQFNEFEIELAARGTTSM
jgi:hypothetical protein